MTEYTAKRARTRGQLLAAGQELLPGAVRRGLEFAIGPGSVTQRAGLSRQTWYRYWRADDSGYLDELIRTTLDAVALLLAPRLGELSGEGALLEPPAALHAVAKGQFALLGQRRVALAQLIAATLAVEDEFTEPAASAAHGALHDYYARCRAALVPVYRRILEDWRREPIPPFGVGDIVDVLAALSDGLALRRPAESELGATDRFASAAVAVVTSLTQPLDGSQRAPEAPF